LRNYIYTSKNPCEEDNLIYISGSIAKKIKNKYPFLEDISNKTNFDSGSWMSYISKGYLYSELENCLILKYAVLLFLGYLTRPSKDLQNVSKVLESIFIQEFDYEKGIVKKLTTLVNQQVKEKCIPNEVVECLVRTRMYIRIREINRRKTKIKIELLSTKKYTTEKHKKIHKINNKLF